MSLKTKCKLSRLVQAMIKTKNILAEKNRPQLLKLLELEKYGQQKMRETDDYHEGIKAFLGREPRNLSVNKQEGAFWAP